MKYHNANLIMQAYFATFISIDCLILNRKAAHDRSFTGDTIMKRYFFTTAALLVLTSFSAFGQSYEELEAEYIKFASKASPNGERNQQAVIVAAAVKNSDGSVTVSLLTDTQYVVPEFTIRAVNTDKKQQTGKINKVSFKGADSHVGKVNPITRIKPEPGSDAVEISLTVKFDDEPETSTALIVISDEPEITGIRIFKRP